MKGANAGVRKIPSKSSGRGRRIGQRKTDGIEDQMVALVRSDHADGVFNANTIQLLRELTAEFRGIAGLNPGSVISFAVSLGVQS